MWTDRWTDRHDQANSHFSQFCEHAYKIQTLILLCTQEPVLTHNLSYMFVVLDCASRTPSVELQAHHSNSAANWQLYHVTTFIPSKQQSHL